jgi:hypothetical protein
MSTAHRVPTPSFYSVICGNVQREKSAFLLVNQALDRLLYCAEWDLKTGGQRAVPPPLFIRYLKRSRNLTLRQSAHLLATISGFALLRDQAAICCSLSVQILEPDPPSHLQSVSFQFAPAAARLSESDDLCSSRRHGLGVNHPFFEPPLEV